MLCVVGKPIYGPGGTTIPSGTIVDPSGWRNSKALIAQRYLRPATAEEIESAVEDPDGPDVPGTDITRPAAKTKVAVSRSRKRSARRKQ